MIKYITSYFRIRKLKNSYKDAVSLANVAKKKSGRKHYVLKENGKFKVYNGQELHYLHGKGFFKKGITLRQIFSLAVYSTK